MYNARTNTLSQCITSPTFSFSTSCAPQIVSNRYLSDLYSCSGLMLNTNTTVGSVAQTAAVPVEINSAIPFISLAQNVMADSTLTTTPAKIANAISRLSSLPKFSNLASSSPFKPCYGAFAMELVNIFTTTADVFRACSNEFDSSCLSNTQVVSAMTKFKTCSGIELNTKSPFVCTEKQNGILINSVIPQYILSQAISVANATIASAMAGIDSALVQIAKTTNETLPCVNCLEDVVVGLFELPKAAKTACATLAPNDCLRLPQVVEITAKYSQCANQTLDLSKVTINPVTTVTPGSSNDTNTTKASSASVVLGSVLLVIGAIML